MIMKIKDFFNTRVVTEKLVTHTLPEGQLFLYFYIVIVYDWLQFTLGYLQLAERLSNVGKPMGFADYFSVWSTFFFTALGLLICFVANGGMKGKDFLSKFFSYSVTVGFKYGIAGMLIDNVPTLLPALQGPFYELLSLYLVNITMISHFAYRIFLTRRSRPD